MTRGKTVSGRRRTGGLLLAALLIGALCAAGVVLLVSGSGSDSVGRAERQGPAAAASGRAVAMLIPASAKPDRITIEKIQASSSLVPLGKLNSGAMETPNVHTPQQAGWYARGVVPGQVGPAIVVGHVDGDGHPGVFKRLHELGAGDRVDVTRADGHVLVFSVYRTDQVSKNDFPTDDVYRNTVGPELRLITCGGDFVGGRLGYADNVVVYLKQVGD